MVKRFLKTSGWTDILISLIFILFGAMLVARPEVITSIVVMVLGAIFIVMGVLKAVNYYSEGKQDNFLLAMAVIFIIVGIVILFSADIILSAFRIIIALWIIYSALMNLKTAIVWKDYRSKLWLVTLILAISMMIAGIYVLVNQGTIIQTVGIIIVIYGIADIIEKVIFIKKVDNFLDE